MSTPNASKFRLILDPRPRSPNHFDVDTFKIAHCGTVYRNLLVPAAWALGKMNYRTTIEATERLVPLVYALERRREMTSFQVDDEAIEAINVVDASSPDGLEKDSSPTNEPYLNEYEQGPLREPPMPIRLIRGDDLYIDAVEHGIAINNAWVENLIDVISSVSLGVEGWLTKHALLVEIGMLFSTQNLCALVVREFVLAEGFTILSTSEDAEKCLLFIPTTSESAKVLHQIVWVMLKTRGVSLQRLRRYEVSPHISTAAASAAVRQWSFQCPTACAVAMNDYGHTHES